LNDNREHKLEMEIFQLKKKKARTEVEAGKRYVKTGSDEN
jgi:hypothetical protein